MRLRQLRAFLVRLLGLLHRARREREFAEELESHLALHIEDNLRAGMSPEEARRRALVKLGGVTLTKELYREQRGLPMLETFWQDLRFGLRMLRKNPGFTLVAILTLALGISANTAIFTLVNSVLLQPLPYRDPERLVRLWETVPQLPTFSISSLNYRDWLEQNQVFEKMAAWRGQNVNLTTGGEPERVGAVLVTASFFPLFGIKPSLGRSFTTEEDQPGTAQRVVLISNSLWQRRFGGDTDILGQNITLNNNRYTVVGVVTGPEFKFDVNGDVWLPLALDPARDFRNNHILSAAARLKPGVTPALARAEMDAIAARLEAQYPHSNKGHGVKIATLYDWVIEEPFRRALLVLFGAVGLVLLIACANVSNLLLSRAAARQKEIAIRSALGAGFARLLRQLLTESLLLALAGGTLGILLAWWGVKTLVVAYPGNLPRLGEIGLDGRVLAFTLIVSLLTALLSGLAPAFQGSRVSLNGLLKEGGWTSVGVGLGRLRRLLVISEIALALVLLVGAGLLVKSFLRLQQVKLGFDPDHVLTMQLTLSTTKYSNGRQQTDFFRGLLDRVRNLPGVRNAAAISSIPFPRSGSGPYSPFFLEGRQLSPEESVGGDFRLVSPHYFQAMKIPMLRGRDFTDEEEQEGRPVVVVNEDAARRLWPGQESLGKRLGWGGSSQWLTVIGVVGDVRMLQLEANPRPAIYLPMIQSSMYLVVQTATEPMNLAAAIRNQVQAIDKDQPIANLRTMEQVISNSASQRRFSLLLFGVFAAAALLLATIGIYGVMSYGVAQRTHEIGIRVALGARMRDILTLVVGEGAKLTFVGVLLGLLASLALTRLMKSLLFEVSVTDKPTFLLIAALLAFVALLACWVPARRATKVDPLIALRHD
jgi:predicted permease